ncbi:hypothetical protein PF008_g17727 [Phytophthora fragariae]|uniref:Uncharacterized protein n=1 Tax=Phytophthora fragariae TaxID=53985 RepID=A0A6G0R7T8_9STRA|nr:hypothetical protein PF008_g17727 [Phytophthora fragariae]
MGDALAVASDWTTRARTGVSLDDRGHGAGGIHARVRGEVRGEDPRRDGGGRCACGSGGGRAEGAATTRRQFRTAASSATSTNKEGAHQAPSRSWPSKLSAFPRSVSSDVSAPRDVAGMTMSDKA